MQDVRVTFTDGPLRGRNFEFEVGRVVIGRLPGEGGLELKGADSSVSRSHAELVERGGEIELRNMSPNGTTVDGKLVLESTEVQPGAVVQIGENHTFSLEWTAFGAAAAGLNEDFKPKAPPKKGPLSSPVVRAVIGVYLLGLIGLAVWLTTLGKGGGVAADDWPALQASYEAYEVDGLSEEAKLLRAERAEVLVRELRAYRTRGLTNDLEKICREIMGIDKDPSSPLFQYGARCLGSQ